MSEMRNVEMSKGFGIVLRKHRLALKLSQEALSEKADIHPTHVSFIERFERNPSLNVAASLAKAMGLTLSEMIAEAEAVQRRTSTTK
jgi:transcriptional regulator with XRE-family HTH domain